MDAASSLGGGDIRIRCGGYFIERGVETNAIGISKRRRPCPTNRWAGVVVMHPTVQCRLHQFVQHEFKLLVTTLPRLAIAFDQPSALRDFERELIVAIGCTLNH